MILQWQAILFGEKIHQIENQYSVLHLVGRSHICSDNNYSEIIIDAHE